MKEESGDELQQSHNQRGDYRVHENRMFWGSEQEVQQQEGTAVNGTEWQCHEAAVVEAAVAEQEEQGLNDPSQKGYRHKQDEIGADSLKLMPQKSSPF